MTSEQAVVQGITRLAPAVRPNVHGRTVLVTGSEGFIGRQTALGFRDAGWEVWGVDNLSRGNPEQRPSACHRFLQADVRNIDQLALPQVDAVVHLAGLASVTLAYTSPAADFQANAVGGFHVAQWAARNCRGVLIYASSSKVYGPDCLPGFERPITRNDVPEPATPYGCSKFVAELYAREFMGSRACVLRQSCIYGGTQDGTFDNGWAAFVARCIADGRPVVCNGDGKQVRDMLHVSDLVALYRQLAAGEIGGTYVVGGGPQNAVQFDECVELMGGTIAEFRQWRPGDQRHFVAANDGLLDFWQPTVKATTGLRQLVEGMR